MSEKKKAWWDSWKVWLWALFVIGSLFSIVAITSDTTGLKIDHNLKLGSEFSGGTLFQLQLAEPATAQQLNEIKLIVDKRLNPNGIKDVTVSNTGDSIILAQVAETDAGEVSNLQELLLKQGRFESFLNGEKVFDGGQIVQVVESPQQGYGAAPTGIGDNYNWTLPFLLNDEAAQNFAEASFHQCKQSGFVAGQPDWDCAYTFFFIDRPATDIVVYPSAVRSKDNGKIHGNGNVVLSDSITVSDILKNAQLNLIEVDSNNTLSDAGMALLANPPKGAKNVIIPASLDEAVKEQIQGATSLKIVEIPETADSAWIVTASGLRDAIALTPSITGDSPRVEDIKDVKPLPFLVIQGTAPDKETAKQRLDDLKVLLKSGALPIPIISINKQTVSASLGNQFLSNVWMMGILALIVVSLIIYIRYREWKVVAPVLMIGLSEVIMILGFAAIVKWNLDLASMAGILAAVGTGVDSEVIMTDEILQGNEEKEEKGLAARAKRAFFIVSASASTSIAAMLPLVILGSGIGKLSGFALTTIIGVLLGILISRPAFQEIIRRVLQHAPADAETSE